MSEQAQERRSNSKDDDRIPEADSKIDHASSIKYWSKAPATANAMLGDLGNFPWYSRIDLRGSANFLAKVRRLLPSINIVMTADGDDDDDRKCKLGVDCGAGVGRVTTGFLSHVCEVVDAVEPVEKFADVLRQATSSSSSSSSPHSDTSSTSRDIYVTGLENWIPTKNYDLIWCQWCVGHITDAQLTTYLLRCRESLIATGGIMVVKENISTDPNGEDMYDDLDSSVTRSDQKFRKIFKEAGMALITSEVQSGFPKKYKLLPVRSYALRPNSLSTND
ncbi:uncharacterized protein TRUGW13939_01681 [Talaromyces rugulosus]|uniref:Alpha N-terminal protein methyltransferase 1 n=1 Tax=Talaromyces rugulosus TaxID=121627 RepID=A0A7H8QN36_TALRU|nr:uncharacterized protein TRUGW13939_01681 [Talaromyces rugulosus]QKX54593.1 hypothetical protein TRUGW13939_01681 [Talaromyces rugulosus]